jgi:peptidoglycan/LPS O-acetylase OafA/YrhL
MTPNTGSTNSVPSLIALRGVAVIMVMLYHCGVPGFPSGYLGVDILFVLSGYLITSTLLKQFGNAHVYRMSCRRYHPG